MCVIILPFDVCHDLTLYACCFKERKAEEAKAAAEQREKDRFLSLSDREKVTRYFELTAFISWLALSLRRHHCRTLLKSFSIVSAAVLRWPHALESLDRCQNPRTDLSMQSFWGGPHALELLDRCQNPRTDLSMQSFCGDPCPWQDVWIQELTCQCKWPAMMWDIFYSYVLGAKLHLELSSNF